MLQNLKLIGPESGGALVAVPYDFDMAGLIKPTYADQAPKLGIAALRNRLFTDFCRSEEDLAPAVAHFNAQKEAIYALYSSFSVLHEKPRRKTIRRLDRFYEIINDREAVEREFIRPCRVKG